MAFLSQSLVQSYSQYLQSQAKGELLWAAAGYSLLKRLVDVLIIWGLGLWKLSRREEVPSGSVLRFDLRD